MKNDDSLLSALVLFALVAHVLGAYLLFAPQGSATITVVEVEPGIRCAQTETLIGVAIDCWRVEL